MSSVEEIEVKVEEAAAAEKNGDAGSSGSEKKSERKASSPKSSEDDDVVVPKTEKAMESKPERARKTILSEMCDHSKPAKGAPSFQVKWELEVLSWSNVISPRMRRFRGRRLNRRRDITTF